MRVEIPEFKRCCCCIPLRYGLLAVAYIRIIYFSSTTLLISSNFYSHIEYYPTLDIILQSIFLIWLVLDVVSNIVFLVAGHSKKVKLLNFQYKYNLVSLVLFVLISIVLVVNMMIRFNDFFFYYKSGFFIILTILSMYIISIVIQAYTLMLTRSEIRKLTNNVEFRFVNNAVEAQCAVDMADRVELNDTLEESVSLS